MSAGEQSEVDKLKTDVMDIKNLMKLKMRLKCRMNRLKRPQFKYSRMAQSERGLQMLSSGFNIQHIAIDRKKNGLVVMKGRLYICTAFKSSDAISFSAYDPKTSKFLRASVPNHLLHKWLVREELSKVSEGRGGAVEHTTNTINRFDKLKMRNGQRSAMRTNLSSCTRLG